MALNTIYRGTWCIDNGDFLSGADRATEAEAEADIAAAESALGGAYTTFVAVVERLIMGDGAP